MYTTMKSCLRYRVQIATVQIVQLWRGFDAGRVSLSSFNFFKSDFETDISRKMCRLEIRFADDAEFQFNDKFCKNQRIYLNAWQSNKIPFDWNFKNAVIALECKLMFSLEVKHKLNDMFILFKHWEAHGLINLIFTSMKLHSSSTTLSKTTFCI